MLYCKKIRTEVTERLTKQHWQMLTNLFNLTTTLDNGS